MLNDQYKSNILKHLKVVKHVSPTVELYNYLRDQILSGALRPGEALPTEAAICEHMGVGRSTIREAMRSLTNTGFIVRTKRGTFVSDNPNMVNLLPFPDILKRAHLKDIIDFRKILEYETAEKAALNATVDDIASLQAALDSMKRSNDIGDLVQADTNFHVRLAQASRNELLLNIIEMIRNELADQMHELFYKDSLIRERAIVHHSNILDAIVLRDSEGAKEAMKRHLSDISESNMELSTK